MPRHHVRTILLVMACVAAPLTAAQETSPPAQEDNWRRCRDANADTRIAGCRAIIQLGTDKPTDIARAYYYRAVAYREKKLFDIAIEDLNASIKLDPAAADVYGERGITLTAAGRLTDAIPDFTYVIEKDPKSAYAFYDRGLCYELLGLDDLAIEDYSAALVLMPNDAFRWERRGTMYFRKSEFDRALNDYEKALTLDPEYAAALYGRGAVKMKKGDLAGGGADVARAKYFRPTIDREMALSGVRP